MDDDDMMYMSDNEDLNGGGEEGGEEGADGDEEGAPSLENTYYNAKGLAEDSPAEALAMFGKVLELEAAHQASDAASREWGAKALKKMCKLELLAGHHDAAQRHFEAFLDRARSTSSTASASSADASLVSEKALSALLDAISATGDVAFVARAYEAASRTLLESKNQRVWFRVNLKLAQALLDGNDLAKLAKVLADLHHWCETEPGVDDPKKGSQLMDVYALEIQLQSALGNARALKLLSSRALSVKTAIPPPRVIGVIRECCGVVAMREHEWFRAKSDFFEAFKNFDEAGSPRRIHCLRCLVLASMLDLSTISPFESPETKPYASDPLMTRTVTVYRAYEAGDVKRFEKCLEESDMAKDSFMKRFVPDLIRVFRSHVITRVIKPYQRVHIGFVSAEIGVSDDECESLLVSLILDNRVRGHIDQVNKIVLLESASSDLKYRSLSRWTQQLTQLTQTLQSKLG